MSHITKLATVKSATAIWEYDPSLPGNRVLGGALDVISAIQTLAIKVGSHSIWIWHGLITFSRSNHLDSESSILRSYKYNAVSLRPSRSLSMETLIGEQLTGCWTEHMNCTRYGLIFIHYLFIHRSSLLAANPALPFFSG
jgi:hypothetical protein